MKLIISIIIIMAISFMMVILLLVAYCKCIFIILLTLFLLFDDMREQAPQLYHILRFSFLQAPRLHGNDTFRHSLKICWRLLFCLFLVARGQLFFFFAVNRLQGWCMELQMVDIHAQDCCRPSLGQPTDDIALLNHHKHNILLYLHLFVAQLNH